MAKDYNGIMLRELEKAGTGAKMTKVPKLRRASPESLLKIERGIAEGIENNKIMSHKSFINASNSKTN